MSRGRILSWVALATLLATGSSQTNNPLSSLPQCAATGITAVITASGCIYTDEACICASEAFKTQFNEYVSQHCNAADLQGSSALFEIRPKIAQLPITTCSLKLIPTLLPELTIKLVIQAAEISLCTSTNIVATNTSTGTTTATATATTTITIPTESNLSTTTTNDPANSTPTESITTNTDETTVTQSMTLEPSTIIYNMTTTGLTATLSINGTIKSIVTSSPIPSPLQTPPSPSSGSSNHQSTTSASTSHMGDYSSGAIGKQNIMITGLTSWIPVLGMIMLPFTFF